MADIAGVEPAVLIDYFPRGVRPLVVTLHDHRAAHQNFAVFRNFYFGVRNRQSGTSHAIVRKITGDDRRSFCQSVTLVNRNADAPEKFGQ